MASANDYGIAPLELNILFGHKTDGKTWACEQHQSCPIRLPRDRLSKFGALKLRHVVIPDAPSPNHGFIQLAYPNAVVTFDQLLKSFTTAYSETLEAKDYALSKNTVTAILINFTEKNGRRVTSPPLAPNTSVRNNDFLKSACLRDNPSACDCGCGQEHHGPSLTLILNGDLWDKRGGNNFDTSDKSYIFTYKDNPLDKVRAFPTSNLVPLIVQREVLIMEAAANTTTEREAKDKALQDLKVVQMRTAEIGQEGKLLLSKQENFTERIGELRTFLDKLKIKHSKMKDNFEQQNADLSLRNKELLSENVALKKQVEEHSNQWSIAYSAKQDAGQRHKVTQGLYNKMQEDNKALNAKVQDLNTQLTDQSLRAITTRHDNDPNANSPGQRTPGQPRADQAPISQDPQAPRSEGQPKANKALRARNEALLATLHTLAFNDLKATNELNIIKNKLVEVNSHHDRNRYTWSCIA